MGKENECENNCSGLRCKDLHKKSNALGGLGIPVTAYNRVSGVTCKDLHKKINGSGQGAGRELAENKLQLSVSMGEVNVRICIRN